MLCFSEPAVQALPSFPRLFEASRLAGFFQPPFLFFSADFGMAASNGSNVPLFSSAAKLACFFFVERVLPPNLVFRRGLRYVPLPVDGKLTHLFQGLTLIKIATSVPPPW